jgi:hypothetical protein
MKLDSPEKITNLPQVTDKLYHKWLAGEKSTLLLEVDSQKEYEVNV